MKQEGVLTHLTLAWSRDGKEKIYVQDRMRERGAELFAWLEQGAHFYICGDAKRMAKDVELALVDVVAAQGGCHVHMSRRSVGMEWRARGLKLRSLAARVRRARTPARRARAQIECARFRERVGDVDSRVEKGERLRCFCRSFCPEDIPWRG